MNEWSPSALARLVGRATTWRLRVDGASVEIDAGTGWTSVSVAALRSRSLTQRWPWGSMTLPADGPALTLGGLSAGKLQALDQLLGAVVDTVDLQEVLYEVVERDGAEIQRWWDEVRRDRVALADSWITSETADRWAQSRPHVELLTRWSSGAGAHALRTVPAGLRDAVDGWQSDIHRWVADRNGAFLGDERTAMRSYFESVEASPLTDDQIQAVVTFDNRVRVIAAAGSGKTSTMVARVGYALERDLVSADAILMLAFNKDAGGELRERVRSRLGAVAEGVTATTFHTFGLRVIGEATGRKPRISDDVSHDDGLPRMQQIINQLRAEDPQFRSRWNLFRLVLARPLADFNVQPEVEEWDSGELRTLNGEVVKSQEERTIADWLFFHGVRYEYERAYEFDTVDGQHSQYHPDFYYPDIDVYHEHFAIGTDGNPPDYFAPGYVEGMEWKRSTHLEKGTTLLETTSASVRDGSAFEYLEQELTARGVVLDEDPARLPPTAEPVEERTLLKLFRAFLSHAKSNRLSAGELEERARAGLGQPLRTRTFLSLYAPVVDRWNAALRETGEVDFDDMLNDAADLIESGRWHSPFQMVLVDEMQDTSNARARLVAALLSEPGRFLYAVGDDWQSINRYAGADLAVMTDFGARFGREATVYLSTTFRSPQSLCDVASEFVMKNPTQFAKQVVSTRAEYPSALRAIAVRARNEYEGALSAYLEELDRAGERCSVLVLGRYGNTRDMVQDALSGAWQNLDVRFSTIHSAKGGEADYVVIVDLRAGKFPSRKSDDPLVALAQPAPEAFPHAEERRVFYVALTRAKRSVLILTQARRESPFLTELRAAGRVSNESQAATSPEPVLCPSCGSQMRIRKGPYSTFYGCSKYPACTGTRKLGVDHRRGS